MSEWKKTWCNLCAVTCGLEMEVEDNKIINVRPDPSSPRSNGYCCRKGRSAKYFVENRDRLEYPKKRVGDHYERISWEQAYKEIAEKANAIVEKYGPRSTAMLGGGTYSISTPAATANPLVGAIGSQYAFNPIGVEFMGDWWTHGRIYGDQAHFTEPDENYNEVIIYWGSNSYVSHQFPNAKRICRGFSQAADKMVIAVDPRVSETARMADMHIRPRIGSDSLYLRALIAVIVEKGWEHKDFIAEHATGWAQARSWFLNFDIDAALEVCQVSREQTEEFARILTTKKWGMHRDLGIYFGRHSTSSSYLAVLLQVICGVALVKGGCVTPERVLLMDSTDEYDPKVWRTPVTNRFPVLGIYPEGVFPDEVLGDNEDRIRMAFCVLSNPARSYPDSQAMEEALRKLELFVAVDCVETETTMLADYVLPSMSAYEADGDIDLFTLNYPEVVWGCRRRIIQPFGEAKDDATIFAELTQAMGYLPELPQSLYDAAEEAVRTGDRIKYFLKVVAWIAKGKGKYFPMAATIICLTLGKAMGSGGLAMNWAVLMTSPVFKSAIPTVKADTKKHPIASKLPVFKDWCLADAAFEEVLAHPQGAIIGMADEDHLMEKHLRTKDKKMHMWCQEIEDYLNEYITPEKEAEALKLKDGNNLYLSSGYRYEAGVNNAMRNPGVNKYRKVWSLLMNPEDAKAFGFEDGETIKLSTNRGSIEIPVEYSWRASKGYCLMPHHFGNHYQGKKLYMNANFLTDRKAIDKLTGNSEWRQTPCRVEKLAK